MDSQQEPQINNLSQQQDVVEDLPEESSGILLQGFLKITDGESGQILLETRA
jgi:hypothetical protein